MIPTMVFDFDSLCRLCMKPDADFLPIFAETGNLYSKIREIFPSLQVFDGDGLPAQVCDKCVKQIDSYCNFKLQCEESDAVFRHHLSNQLNNQHITPKSHAIDTSDLGEESVLVKEESVTCVLEEVKQEPAANNSPKHGEKSTGENLKEDSQKLRKVAPPESEYFETESMEIKNDVIAFASEELNQELDTSNEAESREQLIGRNEDVDYFEEEMCDINELECMKRNEQKCETCSEIFTSKESQQQHKCTTPFRCLICMKVLTNETDLCTHMLKHKNEPCRLCGKTFSDKTYYLRHLRAHSGLGHRCNYCNKLFPSLTSFNIHIRKHTGERPYVCEICGESFARIQGYKCHLRKHTGERPFQCPVCLKTFLSKNTLKNHIRIHTGEKPYVCEICGINFGDKARLWHHTKNVHSLKEKKFKCSLCPKEYGSNCELKAHFRIHTGERPYECQICGRAFTLKVCLTRHLNIHTGEKSYDCTVCNKKFSSSSSRDRHVRTHTGEAPFVCATCNKAFLLRRDLINHVFKFQH